MAYWLSFGFLLLALVLSQLEKHSPRSTQTTAGLAPPGGRPEALQAPLTTLGGRNMDIHFPGLDPNEQVAEIRFEGDGSVHLRLHDGYSAYLERSFQETPRLLEPATDCLLYAGDVLHFYAWGGSHPIATRTFVCGDS